MGLTLLLLLLITGHTVLETARDALLLTGPGPRALGFAYMLIAAATVPGTAVAARTGERLGQRATLACILAIAVGGPLVLFVVPSTHAAAVVTYVLSGVLGSVVVPQFWTLVGTSLTLAEGRRLFSIISAGGIVGGVLGPAVASAILLVLPVKALLVVSSTIFAAAAAALGLVRGTEHAAEAGPRRASPSASLRVFREQPFLVRVAVVVFLSTATFLSLDYLFKSTVAGSLPKADVGRFVAHYYLALNAASLVIQLLLTGSVVRQLGMLPALVLTPLLLVLGSAVALATGGSLTGVLLAKGVDGSLRYSIHRVTEELVYLPVPPVARQRAKPLIDGGLVRTSQMVTGAALLALGGTTLLGPRSLAAIVVALAVAWLAATLTMRGPYLELLRSAIASGSFDGSGTHEPLDVRAAQMLVQRLASEDPREVEGAMTVLSRHDRSDFIPALVLLHQDERVLVRALETFGASGRSDWFELARRLLHDPREGLRVAAARALARHEQLDAASLANDVGWRARGYAAVRMASRDPGTPIVEHGSVAALLQQGGENGAAARLGMLAAIADSPPQRRLWPLLRRLAQPQGSREKTELLATAAARQGDTFLVPSLIALLSQRQGRESVRAALVALGQPALIEVVATMRDRSAERRLRLHMPKTLARFASRNAVEPLLAEIESGPDGLVRYKALRALRLLVTENRISVDRTRLEQLCCRDLEKYFETLGLRIVLDAAAPAAGAAGRALLLELLRERADYSLERAFQELQIAHPRQGVHHAYLAWRSGDSYARASGAELLDTLLRRGDQHRLRALFRIAWDDLTMEERTDRARRHVTSIPRTAQDGIERLVRSRNALLSALGARLQRSERRGAGHGDAVEMSGAR